MAKKPRIPVNNLTTEDSSNQQQQKEGQQQQQQKEQKQQQQQKEPQQQQQQQKELQQQQQKEQGNQPLGTMRLAIDDFPDPPEMVFVQDNLIMGTIGIKIEKKFPNIKTSHDVLLKHDDAKNTT